MFDKLRWRKERIIPTIPPGTYGLVISEGDVRGELDLDFSSQLAKNCKYKVLDNPKGYTILNISHEYVKSLIRAGGANGLKVVLSRVFSEKDGKRFFEEIWSSDGIAERVKRGVE